LKQVPPSRSCGLAITTVPDASSHQAVRSLVSWRDAVGCSMIPWISAAKAARLATPGNCP